MARGEDMAAASRTRDLGDESPREVRCEDVSHIGINYLTYLRLQSMPYRYAARSVEKGIGASHLAVEPDIPCRKVNP